MRERAAPPAAAPRKAEDGVLGFDGHREAADGAGDHHAFDAEVQDARFLDNEFAEGCQQDRGGGDDEGGEEEGDVHGAVSTRPRRMR